MGDCRREERRSLHFLVVFPTGGYSYKVQCSLVVSTSGRDGFCGFNSIRSEARLDLCSQWLLTVQVGVSEVSVAEALPIGISSQCAQGSGNLLSSLLLFQPKGW